MVELRVILRAGLLVAGLSLCLFACTTPDKVLDIKREVQIPKEAASMAPKEKTPPVKTPDFIPVHEDASPIKTRIVDLAVRNTPLQDVLLILADTAGLNLVLDRDVNPTVPISLTLKNVTVEDALEKVFSSVHYFYTVKDNLLFVKVTETRTYELGHPAVIQNYTTDVGGDMLGAALAQTGGSSHLKGTISQKTESDKAAYNFWEVIEKSIEKMLAAPTGTTASGPPQSVTVNRLTGTIVVTATKNTLQKVENFIHTVRKIINRQVVVEAKVIEVTLSDSLKYGIDWTSVSTFSGTRTVSAGTSNFAGVITSGPVFAASANLADFTALLKAIQLQGEVRVLSNPRVNIMNGQTALLSVGKSVSFISSVQTTTTGAGTISPTTTYTINTGSILSGIMLGIVPHINETGEITLAITPIVSDLLELKDEKFGTTDVQGNYPYRIQLPTVNLRQLSTTVKVRNSQMVVIGGLINKREELTDYKIPWLGDLPLLGYLFKQRTRTVENVELVVILQPVITSR